MERITQQLDDILKQIGPPTNGVQCPACKAKVYTDLKKMEKCPSCGSPKFVLRPRGKEEKKDEEGEMGTDV